MPRTHRTASCTPAEAKKRSAIAMAYLEAAESILNERPDLKEENLSVAAGNAVLAGIAASDAICGQRLRKVHHGDDHRGAIDLLRTAVPDGKQLSTKLGRLLDMKDEAHYGIYFVSARKASDAVKAARILVGRAQTEVQR
jgi:hypothetical protein